jgi:hypothetical protein
MIFKKRHKFALAKFLLSFITFDTKSGIFMKMTRNIFLQISVLMGIMLFISENTYAQRWKSERHSIVFDAGISHFLGDLGGGGQDAAHFFGVRDIDFSATRPVLSAKYRFRILEPFSAKAGITWAILSADDKLSGSQGRQLRNLSFTSNLIQFSLHAEYYFVKEKPNPRYSFATLHSIRNLSAYVFTGFSVNAFNPKAEFEGVKYELQPLGTEGQGIGSNPAKYSKIAYGFPIGIGAKYRFTRKIEIGIEISNTYTTSDYIDDAHNQYYDNGAIAATYGPVAAELADRHIDVNGVQLDPYASGTNRRGDPDYNDAFLFTVVTLTYKLKRDNTGLPKF